TRLDDVVVLPPERTETFSVTVTDFRCRFLSALRALEDSLTVNFSVPVPALAALPSVVSLSFFAVALSAVSVAVAVHCAKQVTVSDAAPLLPLVGSLKVIGLGVGVGVAVGTGVGEAVALGVGVGVGVSTGVGAGSVGCTGLGVL